MLLDFPPMKRLLIAIVWLATGPLPATANYLTYSQWAALPVSDRAIYIAGAMDQFTSIVGSFGDTVMPRLAAHYGKCLGTAKMRNIQLAQNVANFASSRPELQTKPVPVALYEYLLAACGAPPTD